MPVADLSYITKTYLEVIKRGFQTSSGWSGSPPKILPLSPANLNEESVGFYLYHVVQRKEYDSFPMLTSDPRARFLPMALNLYYQLTASSILEEEKGPFNEQLMMSIAMKALHDSPIITDTTLTLNNLIPVMDAKIRGRNNRLEITQQPIAYNEAVHNWTAGQASMKLSAYYEVSVIFLEPDAIISYSGRVLMYGNFVFVTGAPRITASQNTISYSIPPDPTVRKINVQPAQAPPSGAAILSESVVSFFGSGFESGTISLRLIHARFNDEVIAAPNWNIAVPSADELKVTVREQAILEKNGMPVDILPGVYNAQVIVAKMFQLPNGTTKEIKQSSNQFPFMIAPRIDIISAFVGSLITITGYGFQYMVNLVDILKDDVEVYAGDTKMILKTVAPNPGEFQVTSPTTILINVPGVLTTGMIIPLRIVIRGVESAPNWAVV